MNRDGRFLTPTPPDCSNGLSAPAIGTSRKPVEAEKPSKREIAENSAHERKREKEAIAKLYSGVFRERIPMSSEEALARVAKLYSGVFRERIPMSSEEALARVPMESKLQWVHGLGKRMVAIGDREADFEYFGPTISQAELEMIDLGEPYRLDHHPLFYSYRWDAFQRWLDPYEPGKGNSDDL